MGKPGIRLDKQTSSLLAHPLRADDWQILENSLAPTVTATSAVIRAAEVVRFRHLAQMATRDTVNGGSIRRTSLWLARHGNLMLSDARALVVLSLRMSADPNVLRAYAKGLVSQRSAKMIVDFLHHTPANMSKKAQNRARTKLLKKARNASADELRAMINHIRDKFDDGIPSGDDVERNSLHASQSWQQRWYLSGDVDCETGAMLKAALDPLAVPRPEPDGADDRRPASKRMADLTEMLRRYLAWQDAKRPEGRARTSISVHIPVGDLFQPELDDAKKIQLIAEERYDELFNEDSEIWSMWMGSMSQESARRLACDCELFTIGLDPNGAPLSVNTHTRFATAGLRHALIARDKGCAFPHCDRPAAWTEAHHVKHWIDRGPTEIDNLVLLCTEHHRSVHHDGWEVVIGPDRLPAFRPPLYFDPLRRWLGPDGRHQDLVA
ncbi:HNH endonuclease signature motif containing protein [Tomitella biformata]|uniref:HNH endonuclease signature motif containing protein n=1 Tax=Tomitella biformata TaxID=630403 RepID=UPI000463D3FB|nr:HNH endonuclease signature motif containing protein [Tomitella biformata]